MNILRFCAGTSNKKYLRITFQEVKLKLGKNDFVSLRNRIWRWGKHFYVVT